MIYFTGYYDASNPYADLFGSGADGSGKNVAKENLTLIEHKKLKAMGLQADIKWIQSELQKVKDPDLITAFKSMLKYREKTEAKDWAALLNEEEKEEIREGIEQLDKGDKHSYESVMKGYRQ